MAREDFRPRSVIIFLIPYYSGETVNLSRYAASKDYHLFVRGVTDRLSAFLKKHYPDSNSKGYGDHSPIDERRAALIGGLGVLGKNQLLINEKYGSYVFIAEVITDIDPAVLSADAPSEIRVCENCGKCLKECPTGKLCNNAAPCLSEITQRKGELSDREAELIRKINTAWGCDECQTVCPHNKNPKVTPIPFFREDRIEELNEDLLLSMDKKTFLERAFAWRGRKTLERNLKILANEKSLPQETAVE
jgi:epoxyqueuosine reductase QueG